MPGSNGTGKTTTVEILKGLRKTESSAIDSPGRDLSKSTL